MSVQEQNRVALQAICPNPAPDIYTHACHKDMNVLNNEPDNLCWGTKLMYEIQCEHPHEDARTYPYTAGSLRPSYNKAARYEGQNG